MRNYYPIPKQITEEVPYTVHVSLTNGTTELAHFPSYSLAMTYYESPACRGENIRYVGLRPTATA